MKLFSKKKRYKPFYKQFKRLRINIQNRKKILLFKKKKWQLFQFYELRRLKRFNRYKLKDQFRYFLNKYWKNPFKQLFKNTLHERQRFKLFYGGLKQKYLKTQILKIVRSKTVQHKNFLDLRYRVLQFFESRLDTVLYRSGFCSSIKEAQKFVLRKHVLINQKCVISGSYILKPNDLIELSEKNKTRKFVKSNLRSFAYWPIPAKHLLINYKTLQILFINANSIKLTQLDHHLNLTSIICSLKQW